MELSTVFDEMPDPRRATLLKRHLLSDILLLSLFATLSGCDSDEEIEEYGKNKRAFLGEFLSLPNGIPSHDTITRVLNAIDTSKFSACLYRHSRYLCDFAEEHHISVDGKVLRATAQQGQRNSGICVVTAWACEQQVVLGQAKTERKSNEKTAIPALLEELDLTGALVSIDAIANGPAIAERIVEQQGHYLLSLKKNQKSTFEQVHDYMMAHHQGLACDKNVDFGSGRIETRTCYVSEATDLMEATLAWKNIQAIIMVHAVRETGNKRQEEYRFYLSDKAESAAYFNHRVREHWSIENHLHWHLDVSFSEDTCRTHTKNGAENRNILRKLSLQLLKQMNDKHSIKVRRKKAGWDDNYLRQIIRLYCSG
ncbi:ISAs1 family transposase [Tunicatimonas pelagia]|uniref:ISAs1 family transposase n=1 Tax=Tunicatimonas pelagia TaxID=931531 RepID=UPI002666DD87|nr:ISAs1 family transposase [Tunicatimonas pelagia]WKN44082.1 ISAs1 family transposase [Tunicatimonas pelagia]WKN46250.1 ISAs1 family transposase [Tunicatimonas pelagia]